MKHLLLAFLFALPLTMNGQQNNSTEINEYLEKSNRQRKTGNVLLITGGTLILSGVIVGVTGNKNRSFIISQSDIAGASLVTLGLLSGLTSVPFYISANSNKKKSLKISPSTAFIPVHSMNSQQIYPVVGINLDF